MEFQFSDKVKIRHIDSQYNKFIGEKYDSSDITLKVGEKTYRWINTNVADFCINYILLCIEVFLYMPGRYFYVDEEASFYINRESEHVYIYHDNPQNSDMFSKPNLLNVLKLEEFLSSGYILVEKLRDLDIKFALDFDSSGKPVFIIEKR